MKHAYIFPGQGSQFRGMGQGMYDNNSVAKTLFEQANEIAGFRISDLMFGGSEEDLKQTKVTQPAVFLHSVIAYKTIENPQPDMVAGHSLGEFSALVANGTLAFEDALKLVMLRAEAMQKACEINPSSMAAVLALDDEKVVEICAAVMAETSEVVVPANFNCPGQVAISGSKKGIEIACERMKAAGARRALVLNVGGAFHSPLMQPAKDELAAAIEATNFMEPLCPIYQNVTAAAVTRAAEIKMNLVNQLTGTVMWTQTIQAMIRDGATEFTEVGPGKILRGLIGKIDKNAGLNGIS